VDVSNTFVLHNRENANLDITDLFTNLGFIRSVPNTGEYQIKKLRLNSSKHVVVVYDEDAES